MHTVLLVRVRPHVLMNFTQRTTLWQAMRYLKEKGFPWHGHLHSGNVLIQDGICRYIRLFIIVCNRNLQLYVVDEILTAFSFSLCHEYVRCLLSCTVWAFTSLFHCRLSGYESMLCGYPSKVRQLMKPSVQQDNKCLDVHSFGLYYPE